MKKTELQKIIKEEIRNVLERPGSQLFESWNELHRTLSSAHTLTSEVIGDIEDRGDHGNVPDVLRIPYKRLQKNLDTLYEMIRFLDKYHGVVITKKDVPK